MLVEESCMQGEGGSEGVTTCTRTYSNGNHATVVTQKSAEGDETKLQIITKEYNRDNDLVFKKTIRQRTDYNYHNDKKGTEKEFIDIIYQASGKKTTRELMVHQYYLDTGKTRSMTWTQYEQIGDTDRAGLVYHSTLQYDNDGTPLRGTAERWDRGQKVATYISWDGRKDGGLAFDKDNWHEWETWIRSVALHAYLP